MSTKQKSNTREPAKTKKDLQEMLAETVRNTQPQRDPKPTRKGRREAPARD